MRDSRQVVIPNASHASNVDNPKAFEREVLAFLEDR
jgi:pimeloyl-ACP methyl ester carboxylesterase